MADWTKEDVDKVKAIITAKAAFDKAFRAEVLANPAATIEKIAGKKIPDGFSVDIIENKPGTMATFVLPNYYGDKLGHEELAAIAGARSAVETNTVEIAEVIQCTVEIGVTVTTVQVTAEVEGVVVCVAVLI
jgi:hypothetical protein